MHVGVPQEIKDRENRVAMVPVGVEKLVGDGHTVTVEAGAGEGSGIPDRDYAEAVRNSGTRRTPGTPTWSSR